MIDRVTCTTEASYHKTDTNVIVIVQVWLIGSTSISQWL